MLKPRIRRCHSAGALRFGQRGLSMVELLVGIAVGLLVVAAAAMLAATQLGNNRRMLLEVQVQQDLRAAMDTVSRDVRRSGARLVPSAFVWTPAAAGTLFTPTPPTPLMEVATPSSGTDTQIIYRYQRNDFQLSNSILGFKLDSGRIQFLMMNIGGWQDLTDTKAVSITGFTVAANHEDEPTPAAPSLEQKIPCPSLCQPANDTSCWPVVKVRRFTVTTAGTAVSDPAVKRSLRAVIRPRNDQLVYAVAYPAVCPP